MRPARRLAAALRLPRRTLRMRLTLLYGGLFLAVGVAALTLDNLFGRSDIRPVGQTASGPAVADPAPGFDLGQLYSAAALAIVAVLSLGLGWIVAGRVVRPLHTMTAITRGISASKLHERLGIHAPDEEVKELADTLDDLLRRLEAAFEAQRHFVANASHELRTPVAAERTLLQVALAKPNATTATLRATCEQLLAMSYRQEQLVEGLLTLANGERGVNRWEPFDLAEIAGKVVLDRRADAERRGVRLAVRLAATPVRGDVGLVESLLTNLVDNALRHNTAGGRVDISITDSGARATISISNTGPVVPADEIDRLFQPFQRIAVRRTRHTEGHGLGLAIVRAITIAHHATLTANPLPDGGLHITVSFPAPDTPAAP